MSQMHSNGLISKNGLQKVAKENAYDLFRKKSLQSIRINNPSKMGSRFLKSDQEEIKEESSKKESSIMICSKFDEKQELSDTSKEDEDMINYQSSQRGGADGRNNFHLIGALQSVNSKMPIPNLSLSCSS
jgi:hypothetical protein